MKNYLRLLVSVAAIFAVVFCGLIDIGLVWEEILSDFDMEEFVHFVGLNVVLYVAVKYLWTTKIKGLNRK